MKRLIIFLIIAVSSVYSGKAQMTLDDFGRISIEPHLPFSKNIPLEAAKYLETKLEQIIVLNGMAGNDYNQRFIITAKVNVVSKDIVPSTPARISQKLEITFIIGDVVENKKYSILPIVVVGIGENETKALISAFNSIKPSNQNITTFVEDAKNKIVSYYVTNGKIAIENADALVKQGKYQQAIYALSTIPNVSMDIYSQCQDRIVEVYQLKNNTEGRALLDKARLAWAQSPNKNGAIGAAPFLQGINSLAECQPQVDLLISEISEKLQADEKREWEFQLQQYEDNKKREQRDFELKVQQHKDKREQDERRYADAQAQALRQAELDRQRYNDEKAYRAALLDASRQVALEYAKNQPKTITNYNEIIRTW